MRYVQTIDVEALYREVVKKIEDSEALTKVQKDNLFYRIRNSRIYYETVDHKRSRPSFINCLRRCKERAEEGYQVVTWRGR